MDMFEPQDHPDDIPYPGGAAAAAATTSPATTSPTRWASSSIASSTRFDGPFEKIPDLAPVPAGRSTQAPAGGGYLLEPSGERRVRRRQPAAESERRRLLAEVGRQRERQDVSGRHDVHRRQRRSTLPILQKLATEKGLIVRRRAVEASRATR